MKQYYKLLILLIVFTSLISCKKYFDVNADPTSPQNADLAAILPPVLAQSLVHNAVDGSNAATLIQNFTTNTGAGTFDVHTGNPTGSGSNGFWRVFYVNMGTSLNLIIDKGIANQNWDYVGVAYALKAFGFQNATDYFGDIPFYQAWEPNRASFEYDTQEKVYKGIDSLLRVSLSYLNRSDGSSGSLSRGDQVYKGDRSKWIKFVYGLLARHYNRLTNKNSYLSEGYADSVIKFVDLSFTSAADNYQLAYPATKNDDTNPFGPARGNFNTIKQSRFITQLLDGTILAGTTSPTARDPRLRGMLTVSADTTTISNSMPRANGGFRFNILTDNTGTTTGKGDFEMNNTGGTTPGVTPTLPLGNPAWRRRVSVVYADSTPINNGAAIFAKAGRYVFQNNAPATLMAYHELQFIKAEAAHRKGNKSLAHIAYMNGINGHFDFVNYYANLSGNTAAITPTQRATYLASPAVESIAGNLSLTDIMVQKYIGDWAWNPYESWADVRRYHYFDLDPETNDQVYPTLSVAFYSLTNLGPKPQYRFSPFINSEFDWNEVELRKIGAFNSDYHTYEMWFTQP